jgi:indolepyruvate ferredoxin oxidoreductase beta subunit
MISNEKRVMLVGVGGQGILLASRILTSGLIEAGYDVKASEVHGMAQRGGSVVTQLAFGAKVYSPLNGPGVFDILVSLEKLEGIRYLHFLKKDGILLVNRKEIPPLPVISGAATYPADLAGRMASYPVSLHLIDADAAAEQLGHPRVMNVVILGALIKLLKLTDLVDWQEQVAAAVRPQFREVDQKALEIGLNIV